MKHIVRAVILIIILYFIANHYQSSDAAVNIIGVLIIFAFLYLLFAVVFTISKAIKARKEAVLLPTNTDHNSGCSFFILLFLLLGLAYVFKTALGTYSHAAFTFTDHLLKLGSNSSPLIGWGLVGLCIGSIYGSFVAWKKYKLPVGINMTPIGILILLLILFYLVNKPRESTAFDGANTAQTTYAYNLATAEVYNASPDDNKALYKPAFLLDSSDKTAWITDVSKSNTEIRFSFGRNNVNKEMQCVGFMIKNGYRKSPQVWENFARAKGLAIKHNGSFVTAAVINDKNSDSEEIKVAPITINSFDNLSITIQSAYEGSKYPNRVAITELVPIITYTKE